MNKLLRLVMILLTLSTLTHQVWAEVEEQDSDPNAGIRLPLKIIDGIRLQQVYIHITDPEFRTPEREEAITGKLSLAAGDAFNLFLAKGAEQALAALDWVSSAEIRMYQSDLPGQAIMAVIVKPKKPDKTPEAIEPTGLFADGKGFPLLYQDDRSKYTYILNGALGTFSETQPWFGQGGRFVGPYQPGSHTAWPEAHVETGLGGVGKLGSSPIYLYGAGTYLASTTAASDIFSDRRPLYGDFERLYGGMLVARPASDWRFQLSGGRQHFQLNRNLLFGYVRGSTNSAERGGSYLSSRIVYDNAVHAKLRKGDWSLQGFYLNPDELPARDTETRYAGTQLAYNNNKGLEASLAYISSPQSNSRYLLPDGSSRTREGLWAWNPRLRVDNLFGEKGLWFETEYVRQGNSNFPMKAEAAYGWLGYEFQDVKWKPGLSYRYAHFSGDDPNTPTYERFDPMQSGGLGTWLQGINFAKAFQNTNLNTHNVNFHFWASKKTELNLDYFKLQSDQLNNLGASRAVSFLPDNDIGQEITLTSRTYLNKNVFILGVLSSAFPGEGLSQALGGDSSPWITVQGSLFFTL